MQRQAGFKARDRHFPLAGMFIRNRQSGHFLIPGQIPPRRTTAQTTYRHGQINRHRLAHQLALLFRQVQFQGHIIALNMRNNQAIGQHGFQFQHPEDAADQLHGINLQMANTPVEWAAGRGVIGNQFLTAHSQLLEMLRCQQHALMPLNGIRQFSGGSRHFDVLSGSPSLTSKSDS